jgi:hypothetical protein
MLTLNRLGKKKSCDRPRADPGQTHVPAEELPSGGAVYHLPCPAPPRPAHAMPPKPNCPNMPHPFRPHSVLAILATARAAARLPRPVPSAPTTAQLPSKSRHKTRCPGHGDFPPLLLPFLLRICPGSASPRRASRRCARHASGSSSLPAWFVFLPRCSSVAAGAVSILADASREDVWRRFFVVGVVAGVVRR